MKKTAVLIFGVILLINTAFAGGILTNTNHSAQFIRMVSRNASTSMDAVYYNPAGLSQMENGFYFALNNQSIFQTRTINSEFPYLNNHDYKGEVTAPLYPSAYAVYKLDNWAFSLGFGPNGGGGSAQYDTGLPSFEKPISAIPPSLSAAGLPTSEYSVDLQFEGSSVFWGTQANATYSISKMLSVSLGVRMINAVNTYNGYIKNIMINTSSANPLLGFDGTMKSATSVFTKLATVSTSIATGLDPYIPTAGGYTLSQLQAAGQMSAAQAALISGGLGANYNSAMTLSQIQSAYKTQATGMTAKADATADKAVDVEQTGTGFTPIIGVNLHFEKLNIGLKYEHQTYMHLTNNTTEDGTGLFPPGGQTGSDIPGIIAGGADYQLFDKLKISGSFTYFLDKNVNWGGNIYGQTRTIDDNYLELCFGAEYKLTDQFTLSAGYLNSNAGVSADFQSDFSYVNDANGVGAGFQWNLSKRLVLDAGAMLITYKDYTKTFDASFDPLAATFGTYNETYGKESLNFAIGLAYKIF